MITQISIRNFKCLRDVQIDLERFTIFVGPNASGKSSILQALHVLCRAFHEQDGSVEKDVFNAMSTGSKQPVQLAAEEADKWYVYRSQSPSPPNGPKLSVPTAGTTHGRGVAPDLNSADWAPWPSQGNRSTLPLSVLLQLETSKLIGASVEHQHPTTMAPDGSGLHSALANMALNDPDSWQQLQKDLRLIIPSIRRLRHTPTLYDPRTLLNVQPPALLFDTNGADSLSAAQVSEGTLLVLGLLTALHGAGRPNLVLLDDLDRGLHPKAQRELIALLRGLLATNTDLQILAATHSPYMLDCMETNEVRMTSLRDDGATECAPLASHPQLEKWKDEMTPGEMWSLFGEKWLVEQCQRQSETELVTVNRP